MEKRLRGRLRAGVKLGPFAGVQAREILRIERLDEMSGVGLYIEFKETRRFGGFNVR